MTRKKVTKMAYENGKRIYEAHVEAGNIWSNEHGEHMGRAADGVEVILGLDGDKVFMYNYLNACPDPKDW